MTSKKLAATLISASFALAMLFVAPTRLASAQVGPINVKLVTLEGVVQSVDMGISQEFPTFTLVQSDGASVTIITGPYYYLVDSGFTLRVGDAMRVVAMRSLWYPDTYAAVELFNLTTSESLALRDYDGKPLWTRKGGPGEPGGPGGGHGAGPGGSRRDVSVSAQTVVLDGVVVNVDIVCGEHYPAFDLALADGSKATILTGPYFFLELNGFVIHVGDAMRVVAIKSLWHDGAYVAIQLNNVTTGASIILRTSDGQPLWPTQGRGGMGDPSGWIAPEACSTAVVTFDGLVSKVSMGCGQEFPNFELLLADGSTISIVTGPYYFLLENDFIIEVGDWLRVSAFESCWYEDTYVAVTLTNLETAATLVLRDATRKPVWTGNEARGDRGLGYGGGLAWVDVDPTSEFRIKGQVMSVDRGMGDALPSAIIEQADGTRFRVMLGPNLFMLQNRFEVQAGDRVKIWVLPSGWFDKIFLTTRIRNRVTGETVTLRDQNGVPMWERLSTP